MTPIASIAGPPLMIWVASSGAVGWLAYAALFAAAAATAHLLLRRPAAAAG
ncbi:hypothetical protein GXW82_07960 [Streptacidiphilus sp. 4-A2]|nr:hypothetical protein [Streptacidiphilus sp. 4-A2]